MDGGTPTDFLEVVREFLGVPCRLEVTSIGDQIIINDAYNANPLSMARFFDEVKSQKGSADKVLIVLGEMLDLGERSVNEHRVTAGLASELADTLVLFGLEYRQSALDLNCDWFAVDARSALVAKLLTLGDGHQIIAFKGSNRTGLLSVANDFVRQRSVAWRSDANLMGECDQRAIELDVGP